MAEMLYLVGESEIIVNGPAGCPAVDITPGCPFLIRSIRNPFNLRSLIYHCREHTTCPLN
jgi:hypothetical protein